MPLIVLILAGASSQVKDLRISRIWNLKRSKQTFHYTKANPQRYSEKPKEKMELDKLVGERRMEPGREQAGVRNRN